jgi:hypothetical protein
MSREAFDLGAVCGNGDRDGLERVPSVFPRSSLEQPELMNAGRRSLEHETSASGTANSRSVFRLTDVFDDRETCPHECLCVPEMP